MKSSLSPKEKQGKKMKRRRGRQRKHPSIDNRPEFFKVFLPDLSSQRLLVPRAFLEKLNGQIHEKATLKDIGGKLWDVDVQKTEDGVIMQNGWQAFVDHYSLKLGEFLVFRYDGNSVFTVKIYRTNGCKEEVFGTEKIATHEKTEKKMDEEIEAEHTCPKQESKRLGKSRGIQEVHYRRSPRLRSQMVRIEQGSGSKEHINPQIAYFTRSITPGQMHQVAISRRFISENNIKLGSEAVLCNDRGEEWPVNISYYFDGRVSIGKGWMAFWKDNCMCPGDQCKFIFDKRKGARKMIKVQHLGSRAL